MAKKLYDLISQGVYFYMLVGFKAVVTLSNWKIMIHDIYNHLKFENTYKKCL